MVSESSKTPLHQGPLQPRSTKARRRQRSGTVCTFQLTHSTLTEPQKCAIEQACTLAGGKITPHFHTRITHLITNTENNIAQRTIKYIQAIACGIWIVNFDWVTESRAARRWLPEEPFEVSGDHFSLHGPRLGRLAREQNRLLLAGHKLHFQGAFLHPACPPKRELEQVGVLCGAVLLTEQELMAHIKQAKDLPSITIIVETTNQIQSVLPLIPAEVSAVTPRWLLDCVSCFKVLDPNCYAV
eukprot:NODE_3306_length_992_cov_14.778035_g3160_i0.p1 GENE.NODE_3306_length_992_cov_14.778035_g3160_i0~~NODE_3306_length_992_cov_14.778035_g3160_i0.p1  ORF type:complete len:242 (-),score=59.77 NODE_3306_length_992_cov_14.778035_g3160_i0:53-778(-)